MSNKKHKTEKKTIANTKHAQANPTAKLKLQALEWIYCKVHGTKTK
jgi:hypothetical protein